MEIAVMNNWALVSNVHMHGVEIDFYNNYPSSKKSIAFLLANGPFLATAQ